jgi:hypothetical protein
LLFLASLLQLLINAVTGKVEIRQNHLSDYATYQALGVIAGRIDPMKRPASHSQAHQRFNNLDLHDDGLVSVEIHPPGSRRNSTRIAFGLKDDSTGTIKELSFQGCANFQFAADFDVLAQNWHFGNSKAGSAHDDVDRMRKFVASHQQHWRTSYEPPLPRNEPVKKKLASIGGYTLFRLAFFGGTATILAKGYRIKSR